MAKQEELPHWGSKGAINRAGDALRGGKLEPGQAAILESWRMAHRDVINSFQSLLRARAKNLDVQVAQRLKRRSTIIDKLSRHDGMQLARMDDVAGCRLIFPSIKMLQEFRSKVHHAKFKHIRKNEKDKYNYIERPSDRGYRGIHDIYEHRSKSKKGNPKCDGLLIEIQYRTGIQHAWSTAVEVVTEVTEHEPKFDRGDRRYVELFRLASEMLARSLEECPPRLFPNLSNKELYAAFEKLNGEIGVMHMLVNLVINDWVGDHTVDVDAEINLKRTKGEKSTENFVATRQDRYRRVVDALGGAAELGHTLDRAWHLALSKGSAFCIIKEDFRPIHTTDDSDGWREAANNMQFLQLVDEPTSVFRVGMSFEKLVGIRDNLIPPTGHLSARLRGGSVSLSIFGKMDKSRYIKPFVIAWS